jgi:hypothetical protein
MVLTPAEALLDRFQAYLFGERAVGAPPGPHCLQPRIERHPSEQGSCIKRATDSTSARQRRVGPISSEHYSRPLSRRTAKTHPFENGLYGVVVAVLASCVLDELSVVLVGELMARAAGIALDWLARRRSAQQGPVGDEVRDGGKLAQRLDELIHVLAIDGGGHVGAGPNADVLRLIRGERWCAAMASHTGWAIIANTTGSPSSTVEGG